MVVYVRTSSARGLKPRHTLDEARLRDIELAHAYRQFNPVL